MVCYNEFLPCFWLPPIWTQIVKRISIDAQILITNREKNEIYNGIDGISIFTLRACFLPWR